MFYMEPARVMVELVSDGSERGGGRGRRPSWGGVDTQNGQWASPSLIYFSYIRNKNKIQFDHKL